MSHLTVLSSALAPVAARRRRGGARAAASLAVVGLALLGTAGCGGDDGGDAPGATPTAESPSVEPTTEETATESPSTEPSAEETPTEAPEAAGIVLDAAGVGGIPMGAPDPWAALETLLGAPDDALDNLPCGPGRVDARSWGALSVSTLEGALWGWDINPVRGALPADVVVASGVTPGQPLSDASALPGATAPAILESVQLLYVEAGGVQYYGTGADPATSEIRLSGVNVVICG